MRYFRVIPRDLFNESKLLKCLGHLIIQLERLRHSVDAEHDGAPFKIEQDPSDGSISVASIQFSIRGDRAIFSTPLNSRETWPLYCHVDDEVVAVFTDQGTLTEEFEALIQEATP